MREILFKAKRKDNGKWEAGYYLKKIKWQRIGDEYVKDEKHYICVNMISSEDSYVVPIEVVPETLCQYTGLTDKNGNKIWENDVVKKHFYTDYDAYANSEEYVGFVKYEDFAWVIKSPKSRMIRTFPIIEAIAYSKDVKHFEVVGNIFDNPEFLKGGAE